MIEQIKYVEDNWERFEQGLRFFLNTFDKIGDLEEFKDHSNPRFSIEFCDIMIKIMTIDPSEDSSYFIGVEKAYGVDGISLDETIQEIKKVLMCDESKKKFLKAQGDGYSVGFNHSDGFIHPAFCASYHNSRGGLVFGLSHIYYGN